MRDARELTGRLVEIDSVNPTLVAGGAGEAEVAAFVAAWLERAGLDVDVHEAAPGRPNVVGRVRGTGGGRTLALNAHLDTVALGGPDGALTARVEGDRLFGRGSYDMKGSLAAIMLAGAELARRPPPGDVLVTAVSDEEAGSVGTECLVRTIEADAAIVAEPTEERLAIAHKGFVCLEVETRGRAAHGSRYDLGEDAIVATGPLLVGLGELDERLRRERKPHPLLGGASVHASLIEGGREMSTYPDRCMLTLERRTLPGETFEQVEAEIRALAPKAEIRRTFAREPLEIPLDEPIARALSRFEVVGMPFWTDAALFAAAGIPAVLFGPKGEGAHADVEWVSLESVGRCVGVYLDTARQFTSDAAPA